MLFSELYGCYFHTVSAVLAEAVQHTLTGERLRALDAVDQRLCARERCLMSEYSCKVQLIRSLGAAGGAAVFLWLI